MKFLWKGFAPSTLELKVSSIHKTKLQLKTCGPRNLLLLESTTTVKKSNSLNPFPWQPRQLAISAYYQPIYNHCYTYPKPAKHSEYEGQVKLLFFLYDQRHPTSQPRDQVHQPLTLHT